MSKRDHQKFNNTASVKVHLPQKSLPRLPQRLTVKFISKRIIHPPKKSKEIKTAAILGTKASVGSWIWVVAWNILINRPTARPIPRIGAATINIVDIPSLAMLRTNSGVTVFPPREKGELCQRSYTV
jgi:hypothetical protein